MQHLILSIILCLSVSNTEDATKYSTSDLSGFDNISNHQENTMLIFGTVRNGTMPVAGADVHLVLNYADSSHPYDDSNHAMTNADGEYFFETSVFDGYSNFNLTLNPWQNNSTTYFPALVMVPVPSTPQEFNFNSQPINPEITINSPNQSSLNLNINDSINLEALVALSFEDGSTTLSSVEFKMNNVVISNTNNQDIYSGTWTPSTTDYGLMHTFTVKAESSNNEMSTETFDFMLNCMGVGCPNILPQVMLVTPANTTINQSSGFQNIPIAVTATDSDGSIAMVNITINGSTTAMTSEGNNSFSYNFTPTNHQAYPIEITAIDNEGGSKTLNETLNITNSQFVPLPSGNIVLGYAHSWQTATAPFLTFNEIAENLNYNVVMYSFIITESDKYTPKLSIYENAYLTNGVFDKQLLIDDIDALRSKDIPVIASIGGATGEVELNDEDEKDVFVQGIINIVDEYGFDGVDIDFEGASMNFGAGALTDISYTGISSFPRLKYVVDAFKDLKQHYGSTFIMTCAPETAYTQTGYFTYGDTAGSFLPVMHNLRNELDLVMVQLYNTGTVFGLDNQIYTQGTPDFLTAMSDMLITGFDVASTGFNFPALPASKILVAIPSCPDAAQQASYISPTETIKALDYMRFGTNFTDRSYSLQNGTHPDLRGVMTWSINWDAVATCASVYEFSESYKTYFDETLGLINNNINVSIQMYPNPASDSLTIKTMHQIAIDAITIYDVAGKELFFVNNPTETIDVSFLSGGLYLVQLKTDSGTVYKRLVKK